MLIIRKTLSGRPNATSFVVVNDNVFDSGKPFMLLIQSLLFHGSAIRYIPQHQKFSMAGKGKDGIYRDQVFIEMM